MNKQKYFVFEHNCWMHKTPLKLLVNPILRFIQFYTKSPWVIASKCNFEQSRPIFIKYIFQRVRYFKSLEEKENFERRVRS